MHRPRALASVLVCQGCCCGHTEKSNPAVPRARLEAAWKARKLMGAVHLRFVDCIGPCKPANLACIKTPDETIWLAGLTTPAEYDALADWAEASRSDGTPAACSEALAPYRIPPPPRDDE
jgi:hypothetical protein